MIFVYFIHSWVQRFKPSSISSYPCTEYKQTRQNSKLGVFQECMFFFLISHCISGYNYCISGYWIDLKYDLLWCEHGNKRVLLCVIYYIGRPIWSQWTQSNWGSVATKWWTSLLIITKTSKNSLFLAKFRFLFQGLLLSLSFLAWFLKLQKFCIFSNPYAAFKRLSKSRTISKRRKIESNVQGNYQVGGLYKGGWWHLLFFFM